MVGDLYARKGAPPEIPNSQKEVLRKYDCYYIRCENAPKTLYLTFDEGYENGDTSKILDVLEQTSNACGILCDRSVS